MSKDDAEVTREPVKRSGRAMTVWWCVGALLAVGAAWWLAKNEGRQLIAAPGELLITMSRPAAIEPPYPVEHLGGQWGLLVLGELPAKYARLSACVGLWWLGAVALFGVLGAGVRRAGISVAGRCLLSLAGLGVFGAGAFLLQAAFRSGANFQRMSGIEAIDPFTAAQLLPLSLATKACLVLAFASVFLVLCVGLALRRNPVGFAVHHAPVHRFRGMTAAVGLSLVALLVLVGYTLITLRGPIPELLDLRLDELTQANVVAKLNKIWSGLSVAAICVQLGGLLWVVASWVAPRSPRRR